MTKYVYTEAESKHISKHGINLKLYGAVSEDIDFKRVSVEEGHFEEFKNTSWFIYYILQGDGVFVLNDEQMTVKPGDIVSIPPNTRIYYFGKLEFTLIVTPPWKSENETHVRDIDPSESPLQ